MVAVLNKLQSRMSDPNKETVEAYNKYAYEYIQHTAHTVQTSPLEMKEWIDAALKRINPNGTIFEIGTAFPRDATYIRQCGFIIQCSDAASSFVEIMRLSGENAVMFNVLEDKFPDNYDMIFANGVFPHFTFEETLLALRNIRGSLNEGGLLAFSVKRGRGESWIQEKLRIRRFAHYWSAEDIQKTLEKEGFSVVFTNTNMGVYPSHRWINIIAKKA